MVTRRVSQNHPSRGTRPSRRDEGMPAMIRLAVGCRSAAVRRSRPLLAMFGIPVVLAVAFLAEDNWAVIPLAFCAWWWAPQQPRWYWLIAIGRGIVATEWTVLGNDAFTAFPDQAMEVGLLWAGVPMLFALRRATPSASTPTRSRKRRPRPVKVVPHLS